MVSLRRVAFVVAGGAIAAAAIRHVRRGATAEYTDDGILIADTSSYDTWSRLLFGSFFGPIADDVAALAPAGGKVLDVGCGPGTLSIKLAQRDLEVTGIDLDPRMIDRAKANAERAAAADDLGDGDSPMPAFDVASASSLPFPAASFDIVVSTLSLHHWSDPGAGLAEIARVLKPTGRALIWDLRPGRVPFHRGAPDPLSHIDGSALRLVAVTAWRWPFRFSLSQRIELVPRPSTIEPVTPKPPKPRKPRKRKTAPPEGE